MGRVRIIGGQWRGRNLEVPDSKGLRPTPDRVRETLFNWLQFEVPGARCLDAFAGSGALGFEAASRSAKSVLMLEKDRRVAIGLKTQAVKLQGPVEIVNMDTLKWLSGYAGEPFDVVFLDPPFDAGLLPKVIAILAEREILAADARVYLEDRSKPETPELPKDWEVLKEKTAGDVRFMLIGV